MEFTGEEKGLILSAISSAKHSEKQLLENTEWMVGHVGGDVFDRLHASVVKKIDALDALYEKVIEASVA